MKRTKKIALILMTVVLMAVCFVFGASAETWGDYEYTVLDDGTVEITKYNGAEVDVEIPNEIDNKTVTSVGDRAFWYHDEIVNISMPDSIKKLGEYAFGACDNLNTINLSTRLESIGDSAFYRCGTLSSISVPDSVKIMGDSVFSNCYSLSDVKLPNEIEIISSNMFVECMIESIDIPDSVLEIGEGAFTTCYKLTNVILPEKLEKIGDYAFIGCFNLKEIFLGDSINCIGIMPFAQCFKLEKIQVDKDNQNFSSDINGVLYNKDMTKLICYPNSKSASYEISESVKEIGDYSFYCGVISEVIIPEGVEKIGEGAFAWCGNLQEVSIPSTVKSIGPFAFADCCSNLEKITVKAKNCELGELSFLDEFKLNSISYSEFIEKNLEANDALCSGDRELYESINEDLYKCFEYYDGFYLSAQLYCHAGSTAEIYAIENGADYVLTHFFEGDWVYNYDNMIRTRKCIHCDELETEPLESTEIGDVEIIEPVEPDTDFDVDEIEKNSNNYIIIDEALSDGVDGDYSIVKAFDITMKNKDGVHVQPDGTVKVKLPLDWAKNGIYKVYRVNDDGTLTDMNAYRQGSHMVFDTDHFSIYVIVDVSEKSAVEDPDTSDCNCICHKEGFFFEILASVFKFVTKLLGVFPVCDCGIAHY